MALWWVIAPLVLWRLAVRLRRLIVQQRYSTAGQCLRASSLAALTLVIALVAFEENASFIALAAGCLVGAAFGIWAVRLTRFEPRDDGIWFRPDRYMGLALALLLIGRIVWRLVEGPTDVLSGWTAAAFVRNPSTMLLYGLFSAHYIVYAAGLVYRVRRR